MATNPDLARTTRYLRFPFARDHRAPLCDGSACPHCDGTHIQKWGSFSGRQRYRCCECGRTFSTFTGTALRYLKHPDRWRRFLWCVDGRLTVRRSAAVLGVNKDTALRWRHRLLEQWRQEPRARLKGTIVIGHFFVPHSAKGSRSLARPARRRGQGWDMFGSQRGSVSVLVAWQRPEAMIIESLGVGRPRPEDYELRIAPRIANITEIVGIRGQKGPVANFARRVAAPYRREKGSIYPARVSQVRGNLRAWLRPFRGVASRRLNNYLEWFRRCGGFHGPNSSHGQSTIGIEGTLRKATHSPLLGSEIVANRH